MLDSPDDRPTPGYAPGLNPAAILLVALALSIGWGVRGNWGHEYGAMIPGALAAMAACLVSGRDDWWRRVAYFAFFGALGWSLGGSISYMQVIAYTHSGDRLSVIYGFSCLFVIGFLWGAVGGAGTAFVTEADRDRLTEFFVPLLAVFAAWAGQDVFYWLARQGRVAEEPSWLATQALELLRYIEDRPVAGYDTDWLAALVAAAAVAVVSIVRWRICRASSLVLHMATGWWLGFTVLVLGLGLRMTPPRGDNWAGILGMTIGMFIYLYRQKLYATLVGALVVGLFGGLGFSGATLIKLVAVRSELDTNWHSVLEQTYGFINGLGVALALGYLSIRTARVSDSPPLRRWTEPFAVAFTLLAVTWLNISKNMEAVWLKGGSVPAEMYGLAADEWFTIAYGVLAIVFATVLVLHYLGWPIPLLPSDWLGKGQLLFLVFLWWIVLGNLFGVLPFQPQRLVTEGVIHVNACLCTLLVLLVPSEQRKAGLLGVPRHEVLAKKLLWGGLVAAVLIVAGEVGLVRAIWHDQFAGEKHAGLHIRFGERATLDKP